MKYFGDGFRLQQAANLFEKVSIHEPEVASLLAKSYVGMSRLRFCSYINCAQFNCFCQMRKLKVFRLWQMRYAKIASHTLCCMRSAISSVRRGSMSGL